MKSKKILTLIFAVLLVFSLFGCGKKEPVEDVEPQDTTEQLDENISDDISGTVSGDSQDDEDSEHQIVEMQQDMLHDLFKEQYEAARMAEKFTKEYGTDSYDFYKKLSAQDIGTQEDVNVYNQVKAKVYGFVSGSGGVGSDSYSSLSDGFGSDAKYYGKYNLPTDGFAQYVSWRQQYEASLNKSTSTSNSSTAQEPSQQPSNNNSTSSGSGNQSQPSGGSTPPNNTGNNGNNGNGGKYSGEGISDDLLNEWNSGGKDKELPKPDYEIIG